MRPLTRIVAGVSVGSLLAAGWFHVGTLATATVPLGADAFQKHAALVIFQAFFVSIAFLLVGVPAYLVARRYSMANAYSAAAAGLAAGMLVSTLYGGPDFRSPGQFAMNLIVFGGSGVIAAVAFWMFVRPTKGTQPPESPADRAL